MDMVVYINVVTTSVHYPCELSAALCFENARSTKNWIGPIRYFLENDRFKIYDKCPMTDVAMAISTDVDTGLPK